MLNCKWLKSFLFLLILELIVPLSCKNPFETDAPEDTGLPSEEFDGTGVLTDEPDEDEQNENSGKSEKGTVIFKLNVEFEEVQIAHESDGSSVTLWVTGEYEKYWWYMSDNPIGSERFCTVDFAGFAENVYPLVFFAQKNDRIYSGIVYIGFDGECFSFSDNRRTILPQFYVSAFSDISVSAEKLSDGSTNLFSFANYTEFSNKRFVLTPGEYTFKVNARINKLKFCGEYTALVSEGINRMEMCVNLLENQGTEAGELNVQGRIILDYEPECISVKLYKKQQENFLIVSEEMDKIKLNVCSAEAGAYSFSYIHSDLEPGIYWIRIDVKDENHNQSSYYGDYVYIESEISSKKEIKIESFYKIYTVTYDYMGGFYTGENPVNHLSSFDTLILPEKEKMMKFQSVFSGWYYDKEFQNKCPEILAPGTVGENLKLYALWTPAEDTIPYNKGLLETSIMKLSITENELIINLPSENRGDVILVDLQNSAGETLGLKIKDIILQENNYSICTILPQLYEDLYTITLYGYKDNIHTFYEKQLIKLYTN